MTKTNFFTNESNQRTQADEELLDLNESMISCKVDPDQWKEEVERVQKQLTLIEKEQEKFDLTSLEEFLHNVNNVVKY